MFSYVLILLFYAVVQANVEEVSLKKAFYFLVSENEHVEADSLEIRLDGGAGYVFRELAVWSVYLQEEESIKAQALATENGQKTNILKVCIENLYLKTPKEKRKGDIYKNALECLYDCIDVLAKEINRLDKGGTQNSSVSILKILLKQLEYLSFSYEDSFLEYANVCKQGAKGLEGIVSGIIYTKDLRYLLCEIVEGFIKTANQFSR